PNGLAVYGNSSDTFMAASKDIYGPASDVAGTDLLIANLTDFEIKAQWEVPKMSDGFTSAYMDVAANPTDSVDYPFDVIKAINPYVTRGHGVFDTWSDQEDDYGGPPEYSYGGRSSTARAATRCSRPEQPISSTAATTRRTRTWPSGTAGI